MDFDTELLCENRKRVVKKLTTDWQTAPNILLVGEPGIGKTTTADYIAEQLNAEVFSVTLSNKRNTDWIKNATPFCQSMSLTGQPKMLIINEIDLAQKNGLPVRGFLDDMLKRNEKMIVIATANSVKGLDSSLLSRFAVINCTGEDLRQVNSQKWLTS